MKTAVIIGAGPAGLTAALELLQRTDIKPVVFEMSDSVGGLARTVVHGGNRLDIGGHRFFSRSERVLKWWRSILPLQGIESIREDPLRRMVSSLYDGQGPDPHDTDSVMLLRSRFSRILFKNRLFDYPLSLNPAMLFKLGLARTARIGLSYLRTRIRQIQPERSLEDLLINRFGRELYETFFRCYTEKVWGLPPAELSAEWGRQRIRSVSLLRAVRDAIRRAVPQGVDAPTSDRAQARWFMYPKLGPGQLWEQAAESIRSKGGQIELRCKVVALRCEGTRVVEAEVLDQRTGAPMRIPATYVFSTMPVRNLIRALGDAAPTCVRCAARTLAHRDFMTVGLQLRRLRMDGHQWSPGSPEEVRDNWIYIQERDVRLGRLQIYNNWSPHLVHDADAISVGLEYYCTRGDQLWAEPDDRIAILAREELVKLGMIEGGDVQDWTVVRVPYAYPIHANSSAHLGVAADFTDDIGNLVLIGRNGMHRYHNMDHSMLTAMMAVDNIIDERRDRANIWKVNTEDLYHESYN